MLASVAGEPDVQRPDEPDSLVVTTDTGDRIHYLDWGAGAAGTPVLLIHDLGSTAWTWAPVARRLASTTRVLTPDLRGHGLSDSPRSGYELESLAFDALTVLVANGYGLDAAGRPAVVAGHGMGGMVAATVARVQPESVAALALVDGGWEDIGESTGLSPTEYEQSIADPPEVLASMDAYLADRRDFDPQSWDVDQERAARSTVDEKHAGHVAPVMRRHALRATIGAIFDYRPIETLAGLPMPLLAIVAESGTGDDEIVRERLLALDDVTRARSSVGLAAPAVHRLRGVGHNVMRYRPLEVAALLASLVSAASAHQRP